MKTTLIALAASSLLATAAQAQDATVVLGSDNRSQGVSQSEGHSFVRGTVLSNADSNFYVGARVETLEVLGSDLEAAVIAGWRVGKIAGFEVEATATHNWLVDASHLTDDTEWEFTTKASRSFGPLDTRFLVQYSPDGYGRTGAWTWTEATVGTALTSNLYASASYGKNQQRNDVDYDAWNFGATYALTPQLGLDVRYYDTDVDVEDTKFIARDYGDDVVVTLNVKF